MTKPATAAERLLELLPDLFRTQDGEMAQEIATRYGLPAPPLDGTPEGPLTSLLGVLGLEFDALEAEVDNLYDDLFIETCAPWLVPYIGALVGARIVDVSDGEAARRQVADTIANRRGKGTARVLARRARNISKVPAEALEYFQHLVVASHLDYPAGGASASVALNGDAGRARRLPGHIDRRVVELTSMEEGGRFAVPNVGVRVWPTGELPHVRAEAIPAPDGGAGAYRISATGADIGLWHNSADAESEAPPRLPIAQIPGPIPMIDAVDHPDRYYPSSVRIEMEGEAEPTVALENIHFCNLGDMPSGGWNPRPRTIHTDKLLIDPQRGRLLLPPEMLPADGVRVTYFYGAVGQAGGGGYVTSLAPWHADFGLPPDAPEPAPQVVTEPLDTPFAPLELADALGAWDTDPAILVMQGGNLPVPGTTALPADARLRIAAHEDSWPTLMLEAGGWTLTGGEGSHVVLRGMRLVGGPLVVDTTDLESLTLVDCTILPGLELSPDGDPVSGGAVALDIRQPGLDVSLRSSICGRIELAETALLSLDDSIVDAHAPNAVAIGGDGGPGGILSAERSTVIGGFRLRGMGEVSDCLFAVRPGAPPSLPLSTARLQQGCVRYSALPEGASVPRRYRCYPDHATDTARRPHFASLNPAHPLYASLLPSSPQPMLTGAEHGREMGWLNQISMHRRLAAMAADLPEWVPFAMQAGPETMNPGG